MFAVQAVREQVTGADTLTEVCRRKALSNKGAARDLAAPLPVQKQFPLNAPLPLYRASQQSSNKVATRDDIDEQRGYGGDDCPSHNHVPFLDLAAR